MFLTGAIIAAIYGAVVGSFLNVCIYRLPRGESLVHPPSHCPTCDARLRPKDLVPVLSYLSLRGKCRYCKTRISPRYAVIEAITALLFLAVWWSLAVRFGETLLTTPGLGLVLAVSIFAAAMLVTFMIDLDTTYVIEPVTWVAMAAGLVAEICIHVMRAEPIQFSLWGMTIPYLPAAVPGMILGFVTFLAMNGFGWLIFRKPGMGLGDSYIGAAIGAMLGPGLAVLSFGMAVFLGALVGITLIIAGFIAKTPEPGAVESRQAKKDAQTRARAQEQADPFDEVEDDLPQGRYMPFGPFLTATAMAVALAPDWFMQSVRQLFAWWMGMNGGSPV
jgi:leader peptidase (prepilin peptidase)/N-methyltransferase